MIEIERTYLLSALPSIPHGSSVWRLEQGYLPDSPAAASGGGIAEGRVRRSVGPDGSVVCTHTIKSGAGLVRQETEQTITEQEFERVWPRTAGRRLRKNRYLVRDGSLTWEIDEYDDLDLVLADVELPSADTSITIPPWLAPCIVREVTEEPEYRNYELATKKRRWGMGDGR